MIALQLEYGCTDFIEELCRSAGGRFVKDTDADNLDAGNGKYPTTRIISSRHAFGVLEDALKDGEITQGEEEIIRKLLNNI